MKEENKMTKRQMAAAETRRKLLKTEEELAAERGFVDVSLDDTVRAFGVARGTFCICKVSREGPHLCAKAKVEGESTPSVEVLFTRLGK